MAETKVTTMNDMDDASIAFSVDPEMHNKLGIKKAKLGEESMFDNEKIYRFQLQKDIAKIKSIRGSYRARNGAFIEAREKDAAYRSIALPSALGARGDFVATQPFTIEQSWHTTSQPYGIIAHKRYLEWLANLPKGPTEDEILDRKQRAQDAELWQKIQTGRTEKTKKDLREMAREKERQEMLEIAAAQEVDFIKQRRIKAQHIAANNFELMRKKPTRRQFVASMDNWQKGIHRKFDIEKGFPVVLAEDFPALEVQRDRNEFETMRPEEKHDSTKYIKGNRGAEKKFIEYMVDINFDKAERFLKEHKKKAELERKKADAAKRDQLQQQRRAGLGTFDLAEAVVQAKFAVMHQARVVKEKDPAEGGNGRHSDSESESDSDSSNSAGNDAAVAAGAGNADEEDVDGGKDLAAEKAAAQLLESAGAQKHKSWLEREGYVPAPTVGAGADFPGLSKFITHAKRRLSTTISTASAAARAGGGGRGAGAVQGSGDKGSILLARFARTLGLGNSSAQVTPSSSIDRTEDKSEKDQTAAHTTSIKRKIRPIPVSADQSDSDSSNCNSDDNEDQKQDKNRSDTMNNKSNIVGGKHISSRTSSQRLIHAVVRSSGKLRPDRVAHKVLKLGRRIRRARRHMYFIKPGEPTPGERRIRQGMKKLDAAAEVFSSKRYQADLVALEEYEIPTDELVKSTKVKVRALKKDIKSRRKRARTADDERMIELLEIRLNNNEAVLSERIERERKAVERVQQMLKCIEESKVTLETMNDDWLERIFKRIRAARTSRAAQKEAEKQEREAQKHYLPEFSKEENASIVLEHYNQRVLEREKERWYRKHYYRLIGVKMEDRERAPTVEDLILATRAGGFIDVIDIAMHDLNPVSPNEVNEDGLTATYVVLMMILKQEVLDSTGDYEDLTATTWSKMTKAMGVGNKKQIGQLQLVLRVLLFNGGKVDFPRLEAGVDGMTVMHSAAEMGSIEMMEWLWKIGTSIDICTTLCKKTPLMCALEHDQMEAMLWLLRNGAMLSLEMRDSQGWTAMHYAAAFARTEAGIVLMICGASTVARNAADRSPSEEAQARGRTEMTAAIMTFKPDGVEYRHRLTSLELSQEKEYEAYHTQQDRLLWDATGTAGIDGLQIGEGSHGSLQGNSMVSYGAAGTAGSYYSDTGMGLSGAGGAVTMDGYEHAAITSKGFPDGDGEGDEAEYKRDEEDQYGAISSAGIGTGASQHEAIAPTPQPMGAARVAAAQAARQRKTLIMLQQQQQHQLHQDATEEAAQRQASSLSGRIAAARQRATVLASAAASTTASAVTATASAAAANTAAAVGGVSDRTGVTLGRDESTGWSSHRLNTSTQQQQGGGAGGGGVDHFPATQLHKPKMKLGGTRMSFRPPRMTLFGAPKQL